MPPDWKEKIEDCHHGGINILAIDATKRAADPKKGTRTGYTEMDILWLLRKLVVGFSAAASCGMRDIHSGAWGCGAFGNSTPLIYTLHVLAAALSGVRVTFHW